jgi:uracil-DNA glycosylase
MDFEILPKIDDNMSISEIGTKTTPKSWRNVFMEVKDELAYIDKIYKRNNVKYYPEKKDLFRAFELTKLEDIRVVIIGQDPYHQLKSNGKPRAQGLSFSVSKDDEIPSSLKNIFKEIKDDVKEFEIPNHGDLTRWTQQGILLLNSSLTVEQNNPGTQGVIWNGVISKIFQAISEFRPKCIYVLWGNHAKNLVEYIPKSSIILTAAHPSGLSANRGFFGCKHFSKINEILRDMGEDEIDWNLDDKL